MKSNSLLAELKETLHVSCDATPNVPQENIKSESPELFLCMVNQQTEISSASVTQNCAENIFGRGEDERANVIKVRSAQICFVVHVSVCFVRHQCHESEKFSD